MNNKAIDYINNSFLKPLISMKVKEISFNGDKLFYKDFNDVNKKYDKEIPLKEIDTFVREIINLTDNEINKNNPFLNFNIENFLFYIIHYSVCSRNNQSFNFKIKIYPEMLDYDLNNIETKCLNLIKSYLANKNSLLICGENEGGKKEFLRFIISQLPFNSEIVILEREKKMFFSNELLDKFNLRFWTIDDNKINSSKSLLEEVRKLTPDWLIFNDISLNDVEFLINCSLSGINIIGTFSSKDGINTYDKLARLILLNNSNMKYSEALIGAFNSFKLIITLKRIDGLLKIYSLVTNYKEKIYEIYKYSEKYRSIPKGLLNLLSVDDSEKEKIKEEWVK